MPRIAIKKKDYMVKDLAGWISGQMHILGLKQESVAQELGITQSAFSIRLNPKRYKTGKDPFSYGDLLTLFKLFGTPDEEMVRLLKL